MTRVEAFSQSHPRIRRSGVKGMPLAAAGKRVGMEGSGILGLLLLSQVAPTGVFTWRAAK